MFDFKDPNAYSNKVLEEKESRKRMLSFARQIGNEREVLLIFAKYDNMLKKCTTDSERYDIAKLAASEVVIAIGGSSLTVGKTIHDQEVVLK